MNLRRWPWFSILSLSIIGGFQVAGQFNPAVHGTLHSVFALDYGDVTHLRLQRLVMSPLVQTRPGFVGTVFWFALVLLPWLELTVGSLGTAVTFFLGDWISTLSTLGVLRATAAFGSFSAEHLLHQPDSGSSSGAFACAGALVVLGPRWLRFVGFLALAAFLAWRLLAFHRLYDVQHLLATLTGSVIALAIVHWPRLSTVRPHLPRRPAVE